MKLARLNNLKFRIFQRVAGWGRSSPSILDRGNTSRTGANTDELNQLNYLV